MPTIPPYTIVDEGTDFLWSQISDIINEMGWRTHDNLMLSLLPSLASTRCAFARNDDDGSFLGGVVWTETDDDFVWIGCGFGTTIWNRAMKRIRASGKIIGLRGAPTMAAKYASRDTPVEISRRRDTIVSCAEMRELEELYAFDLRMTGSDRKALLVPLFASPHFECVVLLDGQGTISAWAGITSVGFPEESLFKLAPVYASSLSQFAALAIQLLPFGSPSYIELVTLFSEPIDERLMKDMCYSPIIYAPILTDDLMSAPKAFTPLSLSPFALSLIIGNPVVGSLPALSPSALPPRIFKPEALAELVLSPKFMFPHIHSPVFAGEAILSPLTLS